MNRSTTMAWALVLAATSILSACKKDPPPPPLPPTASTYTVGGSITGLTSSGLVLQVNGGNNVTVASGATTFTSSNSLASGAAYAVTVLTQPTAQICSVANGAGTVASANVTNVAVTCASTYTVGVTVSGLTGSGLVLQLNGGNNLTPAAGNTALQLFAPRLLTSAAYAVTVLTQPSNPAQQCTVANGSGTIANANVTNVSVSCVPVLSLSGNVSGLTGTLGLSVLMSGTNAPSNQSITVQPGGTSFTLPVGLLEGISFRVIVATQPAGQTCLVTRGAGVTESANITGINVTCVGNLTAPLVGTYTLGGADNTTFTFHANGAYTMYDRRIDDGCITNNNQPLDSIEYGTYNWNAMGTFITLNAPVDMNGDCGLTDGNDPGDGFLATVVKSGNTLTFSFVDDGTPEVRTMTAVPSTTNTLLGSFAAVSDGSITFMNDGTFRVVTTQGRPDGAASNGTFAGLENGCYTSTSTTVTLDLSGACLPNGRPAVDASGNSGLVLSGQSRTLNYIVSGDTLTLGTAPNVVSYERIVVNAVAPPPPPPIGSYTVGGTITGLTSSGLVLQLNNGNYMIIAPGTTSFTAPSALVTGAPFTIAVATQPSAPTQRCTVANSSGNMGSANVTNVAVTCITPTTFTVSGTVTGLTGTLELSLLGPATPQVISLQAGATSFTYPQPLATGIALGTSITAQPAGQTCIVTRSAGAVGNSDLSGTVVTCVANTTSPLAGTYSGMVNGTFAALTFAADGRYLLVARHPNSENCTDANGQSSNQGIEYGVYNWNANTGFFRAVNAVIDTTGECGLVSDSGGAPFEGTITRSGNSLTLAFDDDGTPVSATLTSGPNVSGQLLGTYELPNGRYFTFLGDGTYLTTLPQDRMTGAPTNTRTIGFEHGCYTSTSTSIAFNHTSTCVLPAALPAIDMNGGWSLRTAAAQTGTIPYTLSGDALTLYSGTQFAFQITRVIGN